MSWGAIIGFRLVVADLDRAAAFYEAIGFRLGARSPVASEERAALGFDGDCLRQTMTLGPSRVDLDRFEPRGAPYPDAADAAALCFQHLAIVTDDAAAAWENARRAGAARISREAATTLPASSGGVTAVKFRDPEGHPLEFLQFPDAASRGWAGVGALGVDHSAVCVADMGASRRFYEAQGLRVDRGSLNHGPTQESLDGLDGVEVEVGPMRPDAATTPHLELLRYRRPQSRTCGLVAVNDAAATRVVWRAGRRALVADPDGHWHQLEIG